MHASVRAFLDRIIDYAGLFPPAKLPLEQALAEYLHHKKTAPHRWMLGRFVCPAARLPELLALAKGHPDASLLAVSVLGRQAAERGDVLATLEADLGLVGAFRQHRGTDGVVDTIEVPLVAVGDVAAVAANLGPVAERMVQAKLRGFVEVARSAEWQSDVQKMAARLGSLSGASEQGSLGLKLRCGGVTASAFPSDDDVAFFIARCNEAEIPWKATAGLHHPRRHWDDTLQVWQHGFLNVFGAALLAWTHPLTHADLVARLAERQTEGLRFEEDRLLWGDPSCRADQIAAGRAHFATSFGSCSFTEPCEDLVALGLLKSG